jgi:hypothetical protein
MRGVIEMGSCCWKLIGIIMITAMAIMSGFFVAQVVIGIIETRCEYSDLLYERYQQINSTIDCIDVCMQQGHYINFCKGRCY